MFRPGNPGLAWVYDYSSAVFIYLFSNLLHQLYNDGCNAMKHFFPDSFRVMQVYIVICVI